MKLPRNVSRSSSSSVILPRRSLLRIVDGRRVNNEGRCCPRVDIAVDESASGRKSFELVRRGRLAERGLGGVGFEALLSAMAARGFHDSSAGRDRAMCCIRKLLRPRRMWCLDWIGRLGGSYRAADACICTMSSRSGPTSDGNALQIKVCAVLRADVT